MAAFNFGYISTILLLTTCMSVTITESQAATEYNRYLAHIFQKYGNGGTMTFEVSLRSKTSGVLSHEV